MNLKIKLGKYEFEGPLHFKVNLEQTSGVVAIICEKDGKVEVLDITESDALERHVKTYEHVPCWKKKCGGFIKFAAYYCNEEDRVRITAELRAELKPPCGG
jgi:hypothetical protein